MTTRKIHPAPKTRASAARFRCWVYKLVSPVLVLSLVLFAFPAKTNAAVTIETFNSTPAGGTWTVPTHVTSVDYLVVAGGGGAYTGGGGGGGFRTGTLTVTPGASLTVTVGAGGGANTNGGNSVFASITAAGGGGGGVGSNAGLAGGSGGGGGYTSSAGGAGNTPSTSPSQGNNGGNGSADSGGGGGGAGAVGANAPSASAGGNGGAGTASSISGSSVTYAGGGGGAGVTTGGTGGSGGGGNGAADPSGGTNGTANTGGGGGGARLAAAGNGGSGIVIISYTPKITITSSVTVTGVASVVGALSKGSGSFVIDHPTNPKNWLLYHSFVESPDVKNIYDGIAVLDDKGKATVELPGYFLALNKDFRYLATPIGKPAPDLHLSLEIRRRLFGLFGSPIFEISGGNPGQRISWQVTGIRHDPLILAFPIIVELEKGPNSLMGKGECLFEPLCQ